VPVLFTATSASSFPAVARAAMPVAMPKNLLNRGNYPVFSPITIHQQVLNACRGGKNRFIKANKPLRKR
jgi:hypothetical protein